jgi:hypothetical protein
VLLAACLLLPLTGYAIDDVDRINRVKSAVLLNIARFVTWPDETYQNDSKTLKLCLDRDRVLFRSIDSIHGRMIRGRKLEVEHVETLPENGVCQMLFIPGDEMAAFIREREDKILPGVLTVADNTDNDELSARAMITLVRSGARIGFEIDPVSSRVAGLKISSQLLKHARIVENGN